MQINSQEQVRKKRRLELSRNPHTMTDSAWLPSKTLKTSYMLFSCLPTIPEVLYFWSQHWTPVKGNCSFWTTDKCFDVILSCILFWEQGAKPYCTTALKICYIYWYAWTDFKLSSVFNSNYWFWFYNSNIDLSPMVQVCVSLP